MTPVRRDPLEGVLRALIEDGHLPASRLSGRCRRRLRPLFEAGVLDEEPAAGGRRVVAREPAALAAFARNLLPGAFAAAGGSGMSPPAAATGLRAEETPRAAGILARRNAKAAGRGRGEPVLLRGFGRARLEAIGRAAAPLPVAALTRRAGLAAVRLDRPFAWGFTGRLAVVENLEPFWHVERLGLQCDLALYAGGRLAGLVLEWLASPAMAGARVLHLGDYDPVGLGEYLRLAEALGGRAELYVPPGLDRLVRRYGKPALLADQAAHIPRLRACTDERVQEVLAVIEARGAGLEQEVLLAV